MGAGSFKRVNCLKGTSLLKIVMRLNIVGEFSQSGAFA